MIIQFIVMILVIIELLILARVLMGWGGVNPYQNEVARWIFDLTEPILSPVRNLMPQAGMFDFSPIVVFLVISMIIQMLYSL